MEPLEFEDVYDIGKEIGIGSSSFVHLATHIQTNNIYAVKIIDKSWLSERDKGRLQTEVEIHKSCKHANIVPLLEIFETKHRLYMVMEAMHGGDLFERLIQKKRYPEIEAKIAIRNILKGVCYLHEKGLVHRDLKPENLLLASLHDNVDVSIADFGFSKKIEDGNLLTTPCGSPGYVAPEIANEQSYTTGVDMWSIGITLYTMLAGFPPFYSEDTDHLLEMVSEGKFDFPKKYWKDISSDAKDLIQKLLEKNMSERYTADQALQHPWVADETTGENNCTLTPSAVGLDSVGKAAAIAERRAQMRTVLNKSIEFQRDGCILRSATESSIFARRKQKLSLKGSQ